MGARYAVRLLGMMLPLGLLAASHPPAPIDLPGDRLFPESLSVTRDGTAYVGSSAGGVVQVSLRSGKARQWIRPGDFGTGSIFGVLADPWNNVLWVCSNDFSTHGVTVAGADTGARLKAFDLRSGRGVISLPLPGPHATCNDMTVARDHSVLVTDTDTPRVLRWTKGASALEIWAQDPLFASATGDGLDGIAIGGDGDVYLDNVRSGEIFRIVVNVDSSAGRISRLHPSRPLVSPDGLRSIGGADFLLVEGIGGGRIDRLTVAGDRLLVRTLARNIAEPTGVDSFGRTAWYVQGYLTVLFDRIVRRQFHYLPFRLTPVRLAGSRGR